MRRRLIGLGFVLLAATTAQAGRGGYVGVGRVTTVQPFYATGSGAHCAGLAADRRVDLVGTILGLRWEPRTRLTVADILLEDGSALYVGAPRETQIPGPMVVQPLDRIVITICRP